jgi:protein ImuB
VPFAVVWSAADVAAGDRKAGETLAAVSDAARRAGVHVGQRVAEARAQLANLAVREIGEAEVRAALQRVAEVALAFGTPVAVEGPDTVWVDVTGGGHLWGGEELLAEELASRVRGLSHRARIAVANGPHLARAFARWEPLNAEGVVCVPTSESAERLKNLPLAALSLDEERLSWFARLGVLEVGQLASLPPKAVASRLGTGAQRVLGLTRGHDPAPLTPFEPPRELAEESSWDEPVNGLEPLLFVIRGLLARLSARLEGRGEAAQVLVVRLFHDRAIAEHRRVAVEKELRFELAAPLWRETELERVVRSRLERTELGAPTRGLEIVIPELTVAPAHQLALTEGGKSGADELPVLLAELGADVGSERVGVLELVDSHRPEAQSVLEPVRRMARRQAKSPRQSLTRVTCAFTRLLAQPVQLAAQLRVGESLAVGPRLYSIERVRFVERLEGVGWWTETPASRDYLRLWLRGPEGGLDALVFVDRASGKRYLQALAD